MIYYNDVLVQWNKDSSKCNEIEKIVRDQILGSGGIKEKYFGEGTEKKVRLLYPKGRPESEDASGMLRPKRYPIQLFSSDGQWRYSSVKRGNPSKTNPTGFREHHKFIMDKEVFREKDIEFIWFIANHVNAMGKKLFIEDLEADAKYEIDEMGKDAAIKYMLTSPYSPIAKNEKAIREVAEIFNVPELESKKINQIKLALYDAIVEGEEGGDTFCNFDRFNELVSGDTVREVAFLARRAISDKVVGYRASDRAWYLMSGREYDQKLVSVKSGDVESRDEVFINEVVNNPNVKDRVLSAMGVTESVTVDKLRELSYQVLKDKLKDLTGESKNLKKEEIVEEICKELSIEYVPVT